MLNQEEVVSIMKKDIPKLLQARIEELESALAEANSYIAKYVYGSKNFVDKNNAVINKGVSL